MMRTVFVSICGLILWGCFSTVESPEAMSATEAGQLTSFSYSDWSDVLAMHVDNKGKVNYDALKATRSQLDGFVGLIAVVGPKSRPELFPTRSHRLAYYINAYNALTIFNVINRLPRLKRVVDDKVNFFYFTQFPLDGDRVSLYRLENDIIRPKFNEPRIHFALNCASLGCPQLPARPFLPTSLNDQLHDETIKFLSDERNVSIENEHIMMSEIFQWYADDFQPNPIAWIAKTVPALQLPKTLPVKYRAYDWALNSQRPK